MAERLSTGLSRNHLTSTLLTQALSAGVAAAATWVLAETLQPERFGEFYLILSVTLLFGAIFEGGMPAALLRLLPPELESGNHTAATQLLASSIAYTGTIWLLGLPVLSVAVASGWPNQSVVVSVIALVIAPIMLSFVGIAEARLTAIRKPHLSPLLRAIFWTSLLAASALTALASVRDASNVLLLASTISAVPAIWSIKSALRELFRSRPKHLTSALKERAVHLSFTRVTTASMPGLQAIVLAKSLTAPELGVFGLASAIARPISLVAATVAAVSAPHMASQFTNAGISSVHKYLSRVLLVTVPVAAVFSLCSTIAVTTLARTFFPAYDHLAYTASILLIAAAFNLATGPVGMALKMTDKQATLARITAFSSVLQLTLVGLCGWRFGLNGAAGGVLFATVLNNALSYFALARESHDGTTGLT